MCQEVFDIVRTMDLKNVELQLALQCAPLITGIKVSNLFITDSASESALRVILRNTGLSFFKLVNKNSKTTFLIFRRDQLEKYLVRPEVCDILDTLGYEDFSLGNILLKFKNRYEAYMCQEGEFPHEMGLLLGYPYEDVRGFMEYGGRNYLYSGYWKVYSDVAEKKKLFKKFEDAKESLIHLLAEDIDMKLIMEIFKAEPEKHMAG